MKVIVETLGTTILALSMMVYNVQIEYIVKFQFQITWEDLRKIDVKVCIL